MNHSLIRRLSATIFFTVCLACALALTAHASEVLASGNCGASSAATYVMQEGDVIFIPGKTRTSELAAGYLLNSADPTLIGTVQTIEFPANCTGADGTTPASSSNDSSSRFWGVNGGTLSRVVGVWESSTGHPDRAYKFGYHDVIVSYTDTTFNLKHAAGHTGAKSYCTYKFDGACGQSSGTPNNNRYNECARVQNYDSSLIILDLRAAVMAGTEPAVTTVAEIKDLTDAGTAIVNTYVPDGVMVGASNGTNAGTGSAGGTAAAIIVLDHTPDGVVEIAPVGVSNLTWTLDGTGALTISGTGGMADYSASAAPWYSYRASIRSVVIEDGVTSIGTNAFYGCSSLTDVYYGGTQTQWNAISIGGGNSCLTGATLHPVYGACDAGHDLVHHAAQAPTCTAVGWNAYDTCSRCDYTTYAEIPATGHTWTLTTTVIAPTCTAVGSVTYTCSSCSDSKTDDIPALGHDLIYHDAQAPTYTTAGWESYTCTRCDYITYVELPATSAAVAGGNCGTGHLPTYVMEEGDVIFVPGKTNLNMDVDCYVVNSVSSPALNGTKQTVRFPASGVTGADGTTPASAASNNSSGRFWGVNGGSLSRVVGVWEGSSGGPADRRYKFGYHDVIVSYTATTFNLKHAAGHTGATSNCTYKFDGACGQGGGTPNNNRYNECARVQNYDSSLIILDLRAAVLAGTDTAVTTVAEIKTLTDAGSAIINTYVPDGVKVGSNNSSTSYAGGTAAMIIVLDHDPVDSAPWNTYADNVTWTLDGTGALTVSGTGGMADFGSAGAPWDSYRASIRSVVIGDGVTSIGSNAFNGCSSLTSITIPDSVTSIGADAFYNCSSLTSITIPDSVTSIGIAAFSRCTALTSVTIPDGVTSIGYYAFSGCYALTSITIPDSVTSIGGEAFAVCTSLTSISVAADNPNYKSIGGVLFSKDGTELILYPAAGGASYTIPDSVTSIGYSAFNRCTALTSITIPNSVTSIGEVAFYECTSLTSITIPDSVTSISEWAFVRCTSLTSVIIPDGVTTIGEAAFADCSSLTSITIPDSVTTIGEAAFDGCCALTDVYYGGTQEQWDAISIDSYNNPLLNATLHLSYSSCDAGHDLVHHDAQAATCTAAGWSAYDTCSRCDYTTYAAIPALGHNLTHHNAKAPTCTEGGWEAYDTCTRCDYTTYAAIPALGHDLVHHDAQAATYTSVGWEAYDTCTRCDFTTYVELPVLVHVPGDMNGDNEVSIIDTILLQRYLAGGYGVVLDEAFADLDHSGDVNMADAVLLLRYLAGGYGIVLS